MSKERIMTQNETNFKMFCNGLDLYFDVIDIGEVSSYREVISYPITGTFFSYSLVTRISRIFPTQIILFTVNEAQNSGKLMIDLIDKAVLNSGKFKNLNVLVNLREDIGKIYSTDRSLPKGISLTSFELLGTLLNSINDLYLSVIYHLKNLDMNFIIKDIKIIIVEDIPYLNYNI